jgi:[acyl-carrier-protein] S-malonyltransferase
VATWLRRMPFDTRTAVLFPGQGSQERGMRDLVAEHAPDLLDQCLELIGDDPFERVDDSTRFAQPAIFCASVAGWRRSGLSARDPVAVAGHSLGEFAALVATGALDDQDALRLVVTRAALMAEAGGGTMLALLGASADAAQQLAERHGVVVANDNAPGQIVLSGADDALTEAARDARESGLRAMKLGVAGAFHSPAMAGVVPEFESALRQVEFRAPAVPVISCATATEMTSPRRDLAAALTRPVRWAETMRTLAALDVARFADAGPGRVLAKLARRNVPSADAVTLAELALEPVRG